jgi:hypothetical protein
MNPKFALLLICACAPCWSQTAPAAAASAPQASIPSGERAERNEPEVRHTVTEDEGSKIDELRVRGQVVHVVVTPKVGTSKSYEIIVNRSGRASVDGTGGATSAVGKRVWNVLAF